MISAGRNNDRNSWLRSLFVMRCASAHYDEYVYAGNRKGDTE